MRPVLFLVASSCLAPLAAWGEDGSKPTPPVAPGPAQEARPDWSTPEVREKEEAALAFVREHHAELATLLAQLKVMKPKEYDRAIADLSQTAKSLAAVKQRDPRRYEVVLDAWKAKSKVDLLAARWVGDPSPELEAEVRAALEAQYEVELRLQQLEKEALEARLAKVNAAIGRLKGDRDKLLETRFRGLRNKVQRSRRPDAGKSAPAKAATAKGERKS